MPGSRSAPGGFFAHADFDFEARIVLGAAASGIGDVGLVVATLDRITDGDPQNWFDAWTATAAGLAARREQAAGRGHPQTASWAFLAAAEYYAKALVFVAVLQELPGPRHPQRPRRSRPRVTAVQAPESGPVRPAKNGPPTEADCAASTPPGRLR